MISLLFLLVLVLLVVLLLVSFNDDCLLIVSNCTEPRLLLLLLSVNLLYDVSVLLPDIADVIGFLGGSIGIVIPSDMNFDAIDDRNVSNSE